MGAKEVEQMENKLEMPWREGIFVFGHPNSANHFLLVV